MTNEQANDLYLLLFWVVWPCLSLALLAAWRDEMRESPDDIPGNIITAIIVGLLGASVWPLLAALLAWGLLVLGVRFAVGVKS